MNEKDDCIAEIVYLRECLRKNPKVFYDLEKDQDLALEEIRARDLGITELDITNYKFQ